jgi:hypothetical protein
MVVFRFGGMPLWRFPQQRKMAEAIAAGLWQPLFETTHTLNSQQPDDFLL